MLATILATIALLADAWGWPVDIEVDAFSLGVKVLFKSFSGVLMIVFSFEIRVGRYSGIAKLAIARPPSLCLN